MKLIDLLNKIANGEHPKKFKLHLLTDYIYELNDNGNYYNITTDEEFTESINLIFCLNDEVEIIEDIPKEDKKIEKLGAFNIKKFYDDYPETAQFILAMFNKQEELIDKVNGE